MYKQWSPETSYLCVDWSYSCLYVVFTLFDAERLRVQSNCRRLTMHASVCWTYSKAAPLVHDRQTTPQIPDMGCMRRLWGTVCQCARVTKRGLRVFEVQSPEEEVRQFIDETSVAISHSLVMAELDSKCFRRSKSLFYY